MIYKDRLTLIKEVSKKYNPETKKNETVVEPVGKNPFQCQISPITRQRELATFGSIQVASTVARFMIPIPENVKYASGSDDRKYEVVDLTNYGKDSIIYMNEISQW